MYDVTHELGERARKSGIEGKLLYQAPLEEE